MMFGGMWMFWLFLIGFGFYFWGYGPRCYRRPRALRYEDNPFEIARTRLARGEITVQEYEEIINTLKTSTR
jgi:uncharacterized membrane protein